MKKDSTHLKSRIQESDLPLSRQRRDFLTRSGLVGAVAAVSPMLLSSSKSQASLFSSNAFISEVFNAITLDTFAGVSAAVIPGNDWHSISQQQFTLNNGAVAANTQQFLLENLDNYLPWPQELAAPILSALASAYSQAAGPIPFSLALALKPVETLILNKLDEYMDKLIAGEETVPLAHVFSLILNRGSHLSPFSRLSFSEKMEVFKRLETGEPDITHLISINLTPEQSALLPGLMNTFARNLIQLSAFGAMSEWHALDSSTRTLNVRPVGWEISNYLPQGNVEGWDDFLGYYQNRSSIDA